MTDKDLNSADRGDSIEPGLKHWGSSHRANSLALHRTFKTTRLFGEISLAVSDGEHPVRHRWSLSEIIRLRQRDVLAAMATESTDPRTIALAIWLLSRCGGTAHANAIAQYCSDKYPWPLRKRAAQALRRLQCWNQLREIAWTESDPQIIRIARFPQRVPHVDRMNHFLNRHTAQVKSSSCPQAMYVSPGVEFARRWQERSSEFIRMILERIRRLVRSGA